MCITGCSFDCNLEELTRNETVWCMHTSNVKVVYVGAVDPWLFFTLHIRILGPSQKLMPSTATCKELNII